MRLLRSLSLITRYWHHRSMKYDSWPVSLPQEGDLRDTIEQSLVVTNAARERAAGWLAASVVAFNAGGLAASLSLLTKIDNASLVLASYITTLILCFLSGCGYCFGSAKAYEIGDDCLDQLKMHVDDREPNKLHSAIDAVANSKGIYVPMVIFGSLSLLASVISIILLGYNLEISDKTNVLRCANVQSRMFAASPDRADLPDLFQALGCRPKGAGMVHAPRRSKVG